MPYVSKKEGILAAIEANLNLVTVAHGYNNTVVLVERQNAQLRDEALPCFFLNDSHEDIEHMPGKRARVHLTYTVTGGITAASNLSTALNGFISDYWRAFYAPAAWLLGGLLVDHKILNISTDEGFLTPKACFVATMTAVYDIGDVTLP